MRKWCGRHIVGLTLAPVWAFGFSVTVHDSAASIWRGVIRGDIMAGEAYRLSLIGFAAAVVSFGFLAWISFVGTARHHDAGASM